ncbi:uncharacterized protein LOC119074363 [Bradysia coprophila]|uniref:uncharacterized protein LOC119074363 n=1 Tax=Bradysia coprophila TaxID=38358 RepID=UPI00187DC949|nr:uncharacterized protein LOC119074363 [Bradysia coprophila]
MKISIVISSISLVNLIEFCLSDKHVYGRLRYGVDYKLHETILIDEKTSVPTNYFIIFKYLASHLKPIGYIEFDVNSPSTGSIEAIEATHDGYIFEEAFPVPNFFAKIRIDSTLDVKATLKIYKIGGYTPYLSIGNWGAAKSVTIIYSKAARSGKQPIYAQNSIGKRQSGDELVHFQISNVTNASRFPSRAFEYAGDDYITFVGFSLSSPTAVVLINTTFVGEKEFNAVVYDINAEHFVANVSVYAIKSHSGNRQAVLSSL